MKCEWRYFIVLLSEECYDNFVEAREEDGFLPVCNDPAVAKSFSSPDKLLKWVRENTSLKATNADFKIEGQYLPYV